MLNSTVIQGRITRDPELKKTNSGQSVTSFSLAVERDFKPKDGDRITDFIDCTVFGKTADIVCNHIAKGQMVTVEGRIQTSKYTDKNGIDRRKFEILANRVYFTFEKREQTQDGFAPYDGDEDLDSIFG